MTEQIPISKVNNSLVRKEANQAIEAFNEEIKTSLSYMFTGPGFIRDGVLSFFSSLAEIDTDFLIVIGPRKKKSDGTFEHRTYHICFNNTNGRHFCDFKLKFIRGKYFKLSYPMPNEEVISRMLKKYDFSPRRQSSGLYVTVRLYEKFTPEDYAYLAKVAYDIRTHYDGKHRIEILEVRNDRTETAIQTDQYLPNKADCKQAIEALKRESEPLPEDKLIEWLDNYFKQSDVTLKDNWKIITKENLKIWFG